MTGCGRSASLFGKVMGSLPVGLTFPTRTLANALCPALTAYHASTTAATLSSHGMVTAVPVSSTTIVRGFARQSARSKHPDCQEATDSVGPYLPTSTGMQRRLRDQNPSRDLLRTSNLFPNRIRFSYSAASLAELSAETSETRCDLASVFHPCPQA